MARIVLGGGCASSLPGNQSRGGVDGQGAERGERRGGRRGRGRWCTSTREERVQGAADTGGRKEGAALARVDADYNRRSRSAARRVAPGVQRVPRGAPGRGDHAAGREPRGLRSRWRRPAWRESVRSQPRVEQSRGRQLPGGRGICAGPGSKAAISGLALSDAPRWTTRIYAARRLRGATLRGATLRWGTFSKAISGLRSSMDGPAARSVSMRTDGRPALKGSELPPKRICDGELFRGRHRSTHLGAVFGRCRGPNDGRQS